MRRSRMLTRPSPNVMCVFAARYSQEKPSRPAYIAVSSDLTYASVFKDDYVGHLENLLWPFLRELSPAAGYHPPHLSPGRRWSGLLKFAVTIATHDLTSPPHECSLLLAPMQSFMMYGERGASRAARDRIYLHLCEDYGWLYCVMQCSDTFLLASCSKLCMTPPAPRPPLPSIPC